MLILFHKPFGVLCQFTGEGPTLKDFIDIPGVYPAGRLDKDSEGLVVLTDDGSLQDQIAHPRHGSEKTYIAQVDGSITMDACQRLMDGVNLKDGPAKAVTCTPIPPPSVSPREPPVRTRKHIPTSWIRLVLSEGRNRQVRRMTAAVDFPTLRLIRIEIGQYQLTTLNPGEYRVIEPTRVNSHHAQQKPSRHRRSVRRR
jgi:23S rRNA pseudouridine2457 synthase